MAIVDKNIIQKYLTIASNVLPTKLDPAARAAADANIANSNLFLLNAISSVPGSALNSTKAIEILSKQRELLTPTCVPNRECAIELFAEESYKLNPFTNNISTRDAIDKAISIDYFFLVPLNGGLYEININDLNLNLKRPNKNQGETLKVESINITNNAKDIFTTKATYQIDITTAFTELNDLTDPLVTGSFVGALQAPVPGAVPPVFNPNEKFSFISLIYRFINGGAGRAVAAARDSDGVYLSLRLKINSAFKKNYKNLIAELNPNQGDEGEYLATRTFHCMYHKHDIELNQMTVEEMQAQKLQQPLKNKLKISLVSYEADASRKDGKVNSTVALPDNIYSYLAGTLVDTARKDGLTSITTLSEFLSKSYALNGRIRDVQDNLACFNLYNRLVKEDPTASERFAAYRTDESLISGIASLGLANLRFDSTEEKIEAEKEKLKQLNESLEQARFEINRSLAWVILSNCTPYEIEIPYSSLGVFEKNLGISDFEKNFSWADAATAAQIGTSIGALGGGAGSLVGAGVGFIGYATVKRIQSLFAKEIVNDNLSTVVVRDSVSNSGNVKLAQPFIQRVLQENENRKAMANSALSEVPAVSGERWRPTEEERLAAESQAAISGGGNLQGALGLLGLTTNTQGSAVAANIGLEDITFTGKKTLQFIFFGDLLNFIIGSDRKSKLKVILGGKCFPNDSTFRNFEFVNFYYYPIYLQNFYEFIANNILKRSEPYYSVEVFIKDCFEQLVKQPLMNSKKTIDEDFKSLAPTDLKSLTSLHFNNTSWNAIVDPPAGGTNFKSINLFDDTVFYEFKKLFNKSKNTTTNVPRNDETRKFLLLFSEDEIKFHDFYQEFDDDANFGALSKPTFNGLTIPAGLKGIYDTKKFDEFIVQKYLFPSLKFSYLPKGNVLSKDGSIKFSRVDNPNLTLGNIISNNSFLRLPYNFNSNFNVLLFFFLDVGNYIYMSPPETSTTKPGDSPFANSELFAHRFGYCGLYAINKTSLSIVFAGNKDELDTMGRAANKYSVSGLMMSYGDSINSTVDPSSSLTESNTICTDAQLVGEAKAKFIY